jgi:ATP adenylyltransferase
MKHIWTPWRMTYINHHREKNACVFCEATQMDDAEAFIIARGKNAFTLLNRYPYTSGHILVVPYLHTDSIVHLDDATRSEIMELVNRSVLVLNRIYHPQGFNLGCNIGEAAGAGVAEHVHLHILPRWNGDTNFVTTIGDTRILPEMMEDTWAKVRQAWNQ